MLDFSVVDVVDGCGGGTLFEVASSRFSEKPSFNSPVVWRFSSYSDPPVRYVMTRMAFSTSCSVMPSFLYRLCR